MFLLIVPPICLVGTVLDMKFTLLSKREQPNRYFDRGRGASLGFHHSTYIFGSFVLVYNCGIGFVNHHFVVLKKILHNLKYTQKHKFGDIVHTRCGYITDAHKKRHGDIRSP
jgi:hypothetical protein